MQTTKHTGSSQHKLAVYQWTYQKMIHAPSTHIFYGLGAACSIAIVFAFMLSPGLDNSVNASGLLNFYNIWFIINMPISLLFICIKTLQILREEVEDGTILLIIVKPYSRLKIYGEKLLGICAIMGYYLIATCTLPLIMSFVNFHLYELNSPLIAFQHWAGMLLTVLIMDALFIAICCFLNLIMSSKAILSLISLLIIIGVPLSLTDLIMESSSSKETQAVVNTYETGSSVMAMRDNYYIKNPWLFKTIYQSDADQLKTFIVKEIDPLFKVCGHIAWTSANTPDVNNSFANSPSNLSPLFKSIDSDDKLQAVKLFNAFSSKYPYKMADKVHYNLVLSLYMTIMTFVKQSQDAATIVSPFASNGIDNQTYAEQLQKFNNTLQWLAWFNPVKQWRMMFNEFTNATTYVSEYQGFPNFTYKFAYVRDAKGEFHTDWKQTSIFINYTTANLAWVVIALVISGLGYFKFNKSDIR